MFSDSPDLIFGTVLGQSGLNFMDCVSDSSERIFGTVFEQSRTVLRFSLIPRLMSSAFFFVFCYHCNFLMNRTKKMVHGREGTKRCPVLYGSEI